MITRTLLAAASVLALASSAQAAVVSVSDTVTGSAGAWVHNFSVTNNLPNTNDIYFFGVTLPGGSLQGSPGGFGNWGTGWDNAFYGGSSTVYNTNWIDGSYASLQPGQTLSGFTALDTGLVAQTNIGWFAYAYQGSYNGPECFNCGGNPGFEGLVSSAAGVPEPATWALMIGGFGLAGASLRRRKMVAA